MKNSHEEYVLLSDCDLVANVDYKQVFQFHTDKDADVTVIYRHGMSPDTDKNVVFTVDPEGAVRDMLVKRGSDADCNYGLGKYLIRRKLLMEMVEECMSRNLYDFDRDLLQRHLKDLRVYGYEFTEAAYPITSFGSFFNANMALMDPKIRGQLFPADHPIYTKVRDDMPARYGLSADVSNSIIADGCVIDGEVENCVLFRGVQVKKGARLRNCVIMQDTVVGENAPAGLRGGRQGRGLRHEPGPHRAPDLPGVRGQGQQSVRDCPRPPCQKRRGPPRGRPRERKPL